MDLFNLFFGVHEFSHIQVKKFAGMFQVKLYAPIQSNTQDFFEFIRLEVYWCLIALIFLDQLGLFFQYVLCLLLFLLCYMLIIFESESGVRYLSFWLHHLSKLAEIRISLDLEDILERVGTISSSICTDWLHFRRHWR